MGEREEIQNRRGRPFLALKVGEGNHEPRNVRWLIEAGDSVRVTSKEMEY